MPGTDTEAKSTSWTVAEQFVEERIKLQSNSRIALALRNAKIHRPALYLSAKKSFEKALDRATVKTVSGNSINRSAAKKEMIAGLKKVRLSQTEKKIPTIVSHTCASGSGGKDAGSKLDSSKLRCSCVITQSDASPENPLGKNIKGDLDKSDKTVVLNTVNVKPWENDVIKTASVAESLRGDAERERRIDRNISRLMSLLQERNERRHNDLGNYSSEKMNGNGTQLCEDDGDTTQHAGQKLLKPGRLVYSDGSFPRVGNLDKCCLSGVLTISSKMPSNPWCFHRLPPIDRIQENRKKSNLERNFASYRLPAMAKDCHLCKECQHAVKQVSRHDGDEMESEHLTRLKDKLKLKECSFLRKELKIVDETSKDLRLEHDNLSPSELDDQPKLVKLGEVVSLPKLYMSHHSTTFDNHEKERKARTNLTLDSHRISDISSSATKQSCHKLSKVERMNSTNSSRNKSIANKKSAKLSISKESASAKKCKRSKGLPTHTDHQRSFMTPLRGFIPHCSEFPESPLLWRENTGVQEEEIINEDSKEGRVETGIK